jgi:hypothetical protein
MADTLKNLQATLNDLSGTMRLLTVAALALPLLMIVLWLLFKRREHEGRYRNVAGAHNYDFDPVLADIDNRDSDLRLREQANNLFADDEKTNTNVETASSARKEKNESFDNNERHKYDQEASAFDPQPDYDEARTVKMDISEIAADPVSAEARAPDAIDEMFESAADQTVALNFDSDMSSRDSSEFGEWLKTQPGDKRLSFAIEFLIYWIAYADDRYEPSLRAKVFKMKDPDEHTQIKRWVLQNDIYSFSDSVRWVQTHASETQRSQIIDLLIALLVIERALTPIQNTLFRFLADAFGIGQVKLGARFRRAFDYSLPQLPRVDKPDWWQSQSEEQKFRWNARAVAKQPQDIQFRVKLGLPLTGELQPAEVLACFQRAAARCNPNQFQQLGERELAMVERQLSKFENARDSLLEAVT